MNPDHQLWIDEETSLLAGTVEALHAIQRADDEKDAALVAEARALSEERWSSDRIQREALDAALDEVDQRLVSHRRANRSRAISRQTPYFGHLRLEEGAKARDVLIAKGSLVDSRLPAHVVDWRDAPISRLFYEYEEGEEFCEEIAGREREGLVAVRRRVDVRGEVLQEIQCGETTLRRGAGGVWQERRFDAERPDREDHRLPDIVSLITPDQFAILTRSDQGVVLLRGQAGSGKTTVALHRIAYLHYQDPERFTPARTLVVMFNKALQTYVSKSLSDLDLDGVRVETFHAWAARQLSRGGVPVRFEAGCPPELARLKRHPAVEGLLRAWVDRLGEQSADWWGADGEGDGFARLASAWTQDLSPKDQARRRRLLSRLSSPLRDLNGLLDDEDLLRAHLPPKLHDALPRLREHTARRRAAGTQDFEDAALILRLGQLVAARLPEIACPWRGAYAHVVVDEAQDLSLVEIASLVDAADAGRSVTIAGDPAQTIYQAETAVGFEAMLRELTGSGSSTLDTLPVGHRSSAPIMDLALRALGRSDPALLAKTRPGADVVWLRGADATVDRLAQALQDFRVRRPSSLVAVLCKRRRKADEWFDRLRARLPDVRRGERAGFAFAPGVVVTNVHQVKGLEFDGVVVVDPSDYRANDRRLLHVAITRAADQLWVIAPDGDGLLG